MITRIVKLEIKQEFCIKFELIFSQHQTKIASFEGCKEVLLVKEKAETGVYFTISKWKDEKSIEKYRKSELFGNIWPAVKPFFSKKALAWSTEQLN